MTEPKERRLDTAEFNTLVAPYTVMLKDFEVLGDTPFRLNAFNGVYAPAKVGKTYFVLEQLDTLDPSTHTVIWLDGDRNAELKDKFPNIIHRPVSDPSEVLRVLIDQGRRLDDYILIIDSFKDFTFGLDMDGNSGCQEIFSIYQRLLDKGATLVIIFHATKIRDYGTIIDFKVKGNEDTIESKMDFLYKFERTDKRTTLTVQCSRDEKLTLGEKIMFYDKKALEAMIIEVVTKKPGISLRDLKREPGLSGLSSDIDKLEGILFTLETLQGGRGKPKKVVRLV